MKAKLLSLVLAIALMATLVSATNVFPVEISGNSKSLNAGDSFDVTFKITNNLENENLTSVTIVFSEKDSLGNNLGKITSVKYGSTSFSIAPIYFNSQTLTGAVVENMKILNKTTSFDAFTVTITSNGTLLPGTYQSSIQLKAKNDTGADVAIDAIPVTIMVLPRPVIRIAEVQKLLTNQSGIINISNVGNANINSLTLSASGATVSFSENNFALPMRSSKLIEVSLVDPSQITLGNTEVDITAKDSDNPTFQSTYNFILSKSFCKFGPAGANLSISNIDIRNEDGDEDTWKPLNQITVSVEVENNGNADISDIVVELGLFNSAGKNVANKLKYNNNDAEKIKLGRLNDGDSKKVTFDFVVPADLDEGTYKLAIKAYSKKTGESVDCVDRSSDLDNTIYESLSIDREDDEGKFIAFDNVQLSQSTATCGETLTLSANVYNIGYEDQDRVKVILVNKELGINLEQEIINLDSGEGKPITLTFTIPQSGSDKSYNLELSAYYDYNNGVYRESLDESTKVVLKLIGCSTPKESLQDIQISKVNLESEALAGKPILVRAEIKNTGNQQRTLVISANGYDSWAKLEKISDPLLTLNAGESKSILFTLNADSSASGKKTFNIEVSDGTNVLQSQEVEVEFSGKSSGIGINFGSNQVMWILGIINVILIVLIIMAVLRITRR